MGFFGKRSSVTEEQILEALRQVRDPDLGRDIVSLGFIRNLKISGDSVRFDINLTTPACPVKDQMQAQAKTLVEGLPGVRQVEVQMTAEVRRTTTLDKSSIQGVKNIVAVGSGKGGVGKSTVAVNLAVGMAQAGAKVGLLDGDIYGPSVPLMMGEGAQIQVQGDEKIVPAQAHGVRFMSMGFLVPIDQPLIWRGPMVHQAITQCLFQVLWGELDYLFVDLPPGTGDAHLSLVQQAKVTGAVLVSTPQDVGLAISLKTYQMFLKAQVRILGILENMSYYLCSHCGHREELFGHGGVALAAKKFQIPFLGEVPLDIRIRRSADQGVPAVLADPDSPGAKAYRHAVEQLAAQISIASYAGKEHEIAV